jgi:hypothetical protein
MRTARSHMLHFNRMVTQGDMEKELGLPYSPLCDRNTTLVAESQIGFIDFIVSPSMDVCGDLLDKIYQNTQVTGLEPETKESKSEAEPVENRPKSLGVVAARPTPTVPSNDPSIVR